MRLRIEATPDELAEKSEALVRALADTLGPVAPDIAEQLEKALPKSAAKMIQPALREIHEVTRKAYDARLKWMLKDIGKVLDGAVLTKAEGDEPPDPGEPPPDPDEDPETGEPIFDPQTGLSPSEAAEEKEESPEEEEQETE